MNLRDIERELKKRWTVPYRWGKKQNDSWDRKTKFIYNIHTYNDLVFEIYTNLKDEIDYYDLKNYALNRWYNFLSAQAIENIFCSIDGIHPAKNSYDKLIDFDIQGITFDHKTSVYPKGFEQEISYAINNKVELIKWLYKEQSLQGRKHYKNRLFIVLYKNDGQHWKLKAEIQWLKNIIFDYIENYSKENLHRLNLRNGSYALSDIIWGIK